jgi:hypothetical protein
MILAAVLVSACAAKESDSSTDLPGGERRARADRLRAAGVPAGGLPVHFTVVDDTGARVPGAMVTLVDPTRTNMVRCGNEVLKRGPSYESKQLAANEQGELTATLDFTPLEISASAEDFWSEPAVEYAGGPMTLRLKRIPLVHWRGMITARDGTPLEGVHVYQGDTPWPVVGVAGAFDIKLRSDQPMPTLRFRKIGFSPREVVAQETQTIVLDPRPTLTVSLVDRAGAPVEQELRIEAQRDGERMSFCTTQQDTPASCTLDGEPGPITLLFGWKGAKGRKEMILRESTSIRWVVDR